MIMIGNCTLADETPQEQFQKGLIAMSVLGVGEMVGP